jgi:adenosylcobinamide-GDP ribazoletransferase
MPTLATRGTGAAAFSFVGAGLGLLAALPVLAIGRQQPLLAGALATALLALLTGALHLDGLADTLDGLAAVSPRAAARARKDPRVGPAGAAGLILVLLVETVSIAALARIPQAAAWALVVAGAASRGTTAASAPWMPRDTTGFGAWFARGTSRPEAVVAAITATGIAVLSPAPGKVAGAAGALVGIGTLILLGRRFGVVSGDVFGASIELSFAAVLVTEVLAS